MDRNPCSGTKACDFRNQGIGIMNISTWSMVVAVGLYAVSLLPTIWLLTWIRSSATRTESRSSLARLALDVGLLACVPIAVSIVFLWLVPALLSMTGAKVSRDAFSAALVGDFFVAQLIWSLPSACFYVLVLKIWALKAPLFRVSSFAIAAMLVLLIAARIGASDAFMFAAGVVAQVFGGVLPMSAAAAVSPVLSMDLRAGHVATVDWSNISVVRTSLICLLLGMCAAWKGGGRLNGAKLGR